MKMGPSPQLVKCRSIGPLAGTSDILIRYASLAQLARAAVL